MVQINLQEYVAEHLAAGDRIHLYAETARIKARPGIVGEEIVTKMSDGHTETKSTVQSEGDMVVTNPDGEQYIVDEKTFAKKYELDPVSPNRYRPTGGAQQFLFLHEDVEFTAPWGEQMSIKKGGVLNITGRDQGDIYGIQRNEFDNTYAPCDKNGNLIYVNLHSLRDIPR